MSTTTADISCTDFLYHFTKNNNGVPVYPYVAAVTGHRSFAKPGEVEGIPGFTEEDIKETFKSQLRPMAKLWRKSCGKANAPFVLLTGLADGADQIAAEAAIELVEHEPELNIKVVAVLPMPEHLFINTIKNKTKYNDLIEKVSFKIALSLTKDNIGHESEMWGDSEEAERRRQDQYAGLGHFLAVHSHVLFAFWDGIPSTQIKGGVADSIKFKIYGEPFFFDGEQVYSGDCLTVNSVGPVVHLLIPRINDNNLACPLNSDLDMSSIPVFLLTRNTLRNMFFDPRIDSKSRLILNSENRCKMPVAQNPEIKSTMEKIGRLNKVSFIRFKNETFIRECTQLYSWLYGLSDCSDFDKKLFQNNFEDLNDFEDCGARILAEHYAVIYRISIRCQRMKRMMVRYYLWLYFMLSGILYFLMFLKSFSRASTNESLFHFTSQPVSFFPFSLFSISLILLVSVVFILYYISNHKINSSYLQFRALAEALRIQFFWRVAGMRDCVSSYYRSHQIPETEWIRAAIYGLDVFLDPPIEKYFKAPLDDRIQFTIKNLVLEQREYFLYKEKYNQKMNKQTRDNSYIFNPFIQRIISIGLVILTMALPFQEFFNKILFSIKSNQYLTILGIIAVSLAIFFFIWIAYRHSLNTEKKTRFEHIIFLYDQAAYLLNRSIYYQDYREVERRILRELGMETISFVNNWMLTNDNQDLNLTR